MHPGRTIKIGCWWLLREVELGNCCLRDVTEEQDNSVNILLPASKADVMALGESRGHGCACENRTDGPALMPTRMCPACLLKAQIKFVKEEFPGLGQDAPLFPGISGNFPSKAGVISTITALAGQLGKKEKTHSGAPCWGGHAMRRGGAQYLAAAGVDVWRIQALARHSSAAILAYIEKAHVPTLKSISVEAASGRQQHALATEVAKLKELICKSLRVKETNETVRPYHSQDNVNAKWICTEKAGGKIHKEQVEPRHYIMQVALGKNAKNNALRRCVRPAERLQAHMRQMHPGREERVRRLQHKQHRRRRPVSSV
jgi:hypothetical protein